MFTALLVHQFDQRLLGGSRKKLERLLWVNSSLSVLYHLGGWYRPEAATHCVINRTLYSLSLLLER